MARTFAQLQDDVLAFGFDPTTYRARVVLWLNEAQHRVARAISALEFSSTQTIATVAGTATYTLPATDVRVQSLRNTTDREALGSLEIGDLDTAPSGTGKPTSYAIQGRQLVLYPTPDAAYALELRFWSNVVDMSADSDVPTLPADYADILVSYALSKAFANEDDMEAAAYHRSVYDRELAGAKADLQHPSRDTVRQVPGMFATGVTSPTFQRP